MQLSSALCRSEQARHQSLASSATLANIHGIAMLAAAAWAREAVAAEKREERMRLRELTRETGQPPYREPPAPEDRSFSENPDRGFADAG